MQLYITKPKHTKYGRIVLDNPFKSIGEMTDHCIIWFYRPFFEKPFIDMLENEFCWRWWNCRYHCGILFKHFPEGEVKEELRKMVANSISPDFNESLHNRHYKWIGEIDVEFIRKETSGDFNLYLTKPSSVWHIQYAGIDRCKIFLSKPDTPLDFKYINLNIPYIEGQWFRKEKYFGDLYLEMWESIKDSFDIIDNNEFNFLERITEQNHKDKQSCTEFMREYFFDIKIKK